MAQPSGTTRALPSHDLIIPALRLERNHRISTPHRPKPTPRPGRAREGHARSGGQHRRVTFQRFSRPCRGASRIEGGGAVRFRWFLVAPRPSPPA